MAYAIRNLNHNRRTHHSAANVVSERNPNVTRETKAEAPALTSEMQPVPLTTNSLFHTAQFSNELIITMKYFSPNPLKIGLGVVSLQQPKTFYYEK